MSRERNATSSYWERQTQHNTHARNQAHWTRENQRLKTKSGRKTKEELHVQAIIKYRCRTSTIGKHHPSAFARLDRYDNLRGGHEDARRGCVFVLLTIFPYHTRRWRCPCRYHRLPTPQGHLQNKKYKRRKEGEGVTT